MARNPRLTDVYVDGLNELLRDLRALPKDAAKELRDASVRIADQHMVPSWRDAAMRAGPWGQKLAESVKAKRDRVPSVRIGGNRKAAQLSGINVSRMTLINYIIMGALAGFSGIVMAARLGSASTTAGVGNEMKVITAVIIGGASMSGGEGTIIGGFLGCVLMALISNAMTLLNVSVYWQTFITGFTLLIAVLVDCLSKMQRDKKG